MLEWLNNVSNSELRVSAVTIEELQAGIELTREQDAEKAAELERWLALVIQSFAVVNIDGATGRRWAQLMHRRSRDLSEDAMVAAVASVNNLIVVTRNVRDFEPFGVTTLNPFARPEA